MLLVLMSAACTGGKNSDKEITVRGRITLPADFVTGTLLVGISGKSFDEITSDPISHTLKFIATRDFTSYEIKVPEDQLANISMLQVFAVFHRDATLTKIPSIKKGDLIGFYRKDTKIGLPLNDQVSKTLYADLVVNREFKDRKIQIPVEVSGGDGPTSVGVYCGEIRGFNAKSLDIDNVIHVQQLPPSQSVQSSLLSFSLLQANQNNLCYLFAYSDSNGNQVLDAGEKFGFYADVKTNVPLYFDLNTPQTVPLRVTVNRTIPAVSSQPVIIKGGLSISADLRENMKRFFVIAVRQEDMSFSPEQIAGNILAFSPVPSDATDYELDLTSAGVLPGTKVTVFAIGDTKERGLPALTDGDALGLAIQDNVLVNKSIQFGVTPGFDIRMTQRYYDGRAAIKVSLDGDYRGPMMLFAYTGSLSLDSAGLDPEKVAGFAGLKKTDQKVQADLNIFSIGQKWPLEIYVVALLDANGNQKPDPGESLLLPLDNNGVPIKLIVNNGDQVQASLNYVYNLQIPSNQSITVSGKFLFTSPVSSRYVHIMVAQGENLDEIIADPLKHVRASQKVPSVANRYQIPLVNTSLKSGERVFVFGVTSDGSGDFPSLSAESLIGVQSSGSGLGYVLKAGDNRGLDLIIDRSQYKDKVSVLGTLVSPYRGPVLGTLYTGSPLDLINQTFAPDAFVAASQSEKNTDRFSLSFKTLVTSQRLPLRAIPFLVEDANGNSQPDPGERVWYSVDPVSHIPLSLNIDLGSVFSFEYNQSRVIPSANNDLLSVSGNVRVSGAGDHGRVYILVLDGNITSFTPDQLARHTQAVGEVKATGGSFTIDLSHSELRVGDDVLVVGLYDRSSSTTGFPELSANDLIGIHAGKTALTHKLVAGVNTGLDLLIDRQIFEGQTQVSGRILGNSPDHLLLAAYAGDLESVTSFDLDYSKILGFTQVVGGANARYELPISPIGQPFPIKAYVVAIADVNGNQKLDPGERFYFYSGRSDRVPEKITLAQGQGATLDLNLSFTTQMPSGNLMPLAGEVTWPDAEKGGTDAAYIFVARGDSLDEITQNPLGSLKYFKRLEGRPETYSLTLEETDLKPGDPVLVGILVDKDKSFSMTPGDRVGIGGISLAGFTQKLRQVGDANLAINVNLTIFNTQKSLDVAIAAGAQANYSGRMLAILYAGALTELGLDTVDMSQVVAFKDFVKSSNRASFDIPLLPTTKLPVSGATLITVFDANGNGAPDPGELIGFNSPKAGGMPVSFNITADSAATLVINSFYRLPVPSGIAMSAKAKIDSVFSLNTAQTPVNIALLAESGLSGLAKDPLSYVKAFKTIGSGSTDFYADLSKTDLKPGDRITAFAFNQPAGSSAPANQLTEGAQVGILFNNNNQDTAITLVAGENALGASPYSMQINRIFYEHEGSVVVKIDGGSALSVGDPLLIAAYHIDTSSNNLLAIANQLASIDFSQVIGFSRMTFKGNATITIPILPAITPGLVDPSTRKIRDVIIAAFRDSNNNGKLDSGEASAIYTENSLFGPTLKVLSLAQNSLPGSITFTGATANLGGILLPTQITPSK